MENGDIDIRYHQNQILNKVFRTHEPIMGSPLALFKDWATKETFHPTLRNKKYWNHKLKTPELNDVIPKLGTKQGHWPGSHQWKTN
ncbi:unnamed protein product [Ambrosiozyma monospora]|uniref:Unnamed protein product n=1 Tax=Ambrosiozyma monospora TaxID=43982 RepID=A0ACB5TZ81_AMBMO|nr:unnamed protein product [Ambrosiozyma monospora]